MLSSRFFPLLPSSSSCHVFLPIFPLSFPPIVMLTFRFSANNHLLEVWGVLRTFLRSKPLLGLICGILPAFSRRKCKSCHISSVKLDVSCFRNPAGPKEGTVPVFVQQVTIQPWMGRIRVVSTTGKLEIVGNRRETSIVPGETRVLEFFSGILH